jgi:oxepin-CoA hydrolase/3-oxo-5,6-dehydrosuberyl-CoA semialdehyde dehydrogenase
MPIAVSVDHPQTRERYLRHMLRECLDALRDDAVPRWGGMSAQQMVEHLLWSFEASTGKVVLTCPFPAEKLELLRPFLYDDRPARPGFRNPLLEAGLPPLRFPGLEASTSALAGEADVFLKAWRSTPRLSRTHPVFGELTLDEWSRAHVKHCVHHFEQFGVVPEGIVARPGAPE